MKLKSRIVVISGIGISIALACIVPLIYIGTNDSILPFKENLASEVNSGERGAQATFLRNDTEVGRVECSIDYPVDNRYSIRVLARPSFGQYHLDSLYLEFNSVQEPFPDIVLRPNQGLPDLEYHYTRNGGGVLVEIDDVGFSGSCNTILDFYLCGSDVPSEFSLHVALQLHNTNSLPKLWALKGEADLQVDFESVLL